MAEQPQQAQPAGAAAVDTSVADALIDKIDLDHEYIDLYRKGIAGVKR